MMKVKEFIALVEKHKLHDACILEINGNNATLDPMNGKGVLSFNKYFTRVEWLTEEEIQDIRKNESTAVN